MALQTVDANMRKAIFSGIADAPMSGMKGARLQDGTYWCRIDKLFLKPCQGMIAASILEMTIVRIVLPNNAGTSNPVGETVTDFKWASGPKSKSYLGNMKAMLCGLFADMKPEEVKESDLEFVYASDNPLRNTIAEVRANTIVLPSTGRPYTFIDYKREVPKREALKVLDAGVVSTYFPNNYLERSAAEEEAEMERLAKLTENKKAA